MSKKYKLNRYLKTRLNNNNWYRIVSVLYQVHHVLHHSRTRHSALATTLFRLQLLNIEIIVRISAMFIEQKESNLCILLIKAKYSV